LDGPRIATQQRQTGEISGQNRPPNAHGEQKIVDSATKSGRDTFPSRESMYNAILATPLGDAARSLRTDWVKAWHKAARTLSLTPHLCRSTARRVRRRGGLLRCHLPCPRAARAKTLRHRRPQKSRRRPRHLALILRTRQLRNPHPSPATSLSSLHHPVRSRLPSWLRLHKSARPRHKR
jgi:hypothetical protein